MTLYELKMYIKRFKIFKYFLNRKSIKQDEKKILALKERGLNLLSDVERALKNEDLLYFVNYGTLLGIIRDNNFISWDNDIDYGIVIDNKFSWSNLEKLLNNNGFSKIREFVLRGEILEQAYSKEELTVDFFGYKNINDKSIGYIFYRKEDYIYRSRDEYHVREYNNPQISSTKLVNFQGIEVKIPVNCEDYLESLYTKNWKIPDPEWDFFDNTNNNIKDLNEIAYVKYY